MCVTKKTGICRIHHVKSRLTVNISAAREKQVLVQLVSWPMPNYVGDFVILILRNRKGWERSLAHLPLENWVALQTTCTGHLSGHLSLSLSRTHLTLTSTHPIGLWPKKDYNIARVHACGNQIIALGGCSVLLRLVFCSHAKSSCFCFSSPYMSQQSWKTQSWPLFWDMTCNLADAIRNYEINLNLEQVSVAPSLCHRCMLGAEHFLPVNILPAFSCLTYKQPGSWW